MASSPSTTPETTTTTSSRCITEHVTATLNFEVNNFLQLKGMGFGKFVASSVFRVGGFDWEMRFYPNGFSSSCGGHASCFLRYLGQADGVRAKFRLEMLAEKQAQPPQMLVSHGAVEHTFSPAANDWGFPRFAARSDLKSVSRQHGGGGHHGFTIRCELTVRNESPAMELPGHLERMLLDGPGADVTFAVGGEELFRAHGSLLAARSPVFRAQLFGPMAEKDTRRVEVVDVHPAVFGMMLHYIYTDSLPPGIGDSTAAMQHLLVAADRYGLERLKLMCEEELCKRIDVETVVTTLALARQHSCGRLKGACLTFMTSSAEVLAAVVETDGFNEHLKACCRPLALEGSSEDKGGQPSSVERKY